MMSTPSAPAALAAARSAAIFSLVVKMDRSFL